MAWTHRFKVLLTAPGLSIREGDGLRYLIRLLCQPPQERAAYGWPAKHHEFGPDLVYQRLLGSAKRRRVGRRPR